MANQVVISGGITSEPELRYLNSGKAVCNFSIRVVTGKKQDGQEYAPSMFLDITAWEKLGENVAESLHKGDRVVVTGKLSEDEWEDKETGQKRRKTKIIAFEVAADLSYATASVNNNERASGGSSRAASPAPAAADPGF